ncbi:hypothetical protein [Vibrio jasicida]|uniref:hypothetical protein n=1 Tax=Vibrio jasicida TaxID=766224 RepID=UPI0005EE9E89|nr:hypothetical protein [Vibrio jasicida]
MSQQHNLNANEAATQVMDEFDEMLQDTIVSEYVVNEHILGDIEANGHKYECVLVLREKP